MMLVLTALTALAGSDGQPRYDMEFTHAGAVWELRDHALIRDGQPVASDVHGLVAYAGDTLAFARVVEPPVGTELVVIRAGKERRLLGPAEQPDRVALSPDGRHIAYVSGHTGLASVWVLDLNGGEPVQLTNVGLRVAKGGRPDGFVPPPHLLPPVFDGDRLTWDSPEGPQSVRWR